MRSEYLKEKILEFSVKALISEGLFLCRKGGYKQYGRA
jgi:hypothetical protein|nr:MAG TPA: hypothetical protein [Caudoviricetes sp.]DAW41596.1 MAG TPA: hypothetical protein [Caudoviricetes sp.]